MTSVDGHVPFDHGIGHVTLYHGTGQVTFDHGIAQVLGLKDPPGDRTQLDGHWHIHRPPLGRSGSLVHMGPTRDSVVAGVHMVTVAHRKAVYDRMDLFWEEGNLDNDCPVHGKGMPCENHKKLPLPCSYMDQGHIVLHGKAHQDQVYVAEMKVGNRNVGCLVEGAWLVPHIPHHAFGHIARIHVQVHGLDISLEGIPVSRCHTYFAHIVLKGQAP